MNFDKVQQLIAVITAVIGVAGVVYKVFKRKEDVYTQYTDRYYLKVLEPLIQKTIKENCPLKEICMEYINKEYHCVPTYISYMIHLVNRGTTRYSWDDIEQVIIVDYLSNRPSSHNSFIKGMDSIERKYNYIANVIISILAMALIGIGIAVGVLGVYGVGLVIQGEMSLLNVVGCMLIAIVVVIAAIICMKNIAMSEDEMYPKSIDTIEKIIKRKLGVYKGLGQEYKDWNEDLEVNTKDMLFLNINKIIDDVSAEL